MPNINTRIIIGNTNYQSLKDRLQKVFDDDDIFFYSDELLHKLTDAVMNELTNCTPKQKEEKDYKK